MLMTPPASYSPFSMNRQTIQPLSVPGLQGQPNSSSMSGGAPTGMMGLPGGMPTGMMGLPGGGGPTGIMGRPTGAPGMGAASGVPQIAPGMTPMSQPQFQQFVNQISPSAQGASGQASPTGMMGLPTGAPGGAPTGMMGLPTGAPGGAPGMGIAQSPGAPQPMARALGR